MGEVRAAMDARNASGTESPLRIVIGENNTDLATTVSLLLESEPDMSCCAAVSSGSAVLRTLEEHSPNAFILDLSLDDGPSLPLISTLRARVPQAAIVVFTGYRNPVLNEQCLQAGANEVVVKTGDIDALIDALRRAASHGARGGHDAGSVGRAHLT
jgi:DNA-binding NarL/FixJ family response regulator